MNKFDLMAEKAEYKPRIYQKGKRGAKPLCPNCPKLIECQERVKIGKWVMCEIPDELDLLRMETI